MAYGSLDTLSIANELEAVGLTRAQAQTHAAILQRQMEQQYNVINEFTKERNEALNNLKKESAETSSNLEERLYRDLATKADLMTVKSELKAEMQEIRGEIQEVRGEIQEVKFELLKWMVAGFLTNAALIIGILGFLKKI